MSNGMDAVNDIRVNWAINDAKRDEDLTTPGTVERFDDIVYGEDKKWQSLDVYRPKAFADKKLPVIVSVHGGAWVYGDKELYQYYTMSLCEHGFAVINFSYRLAPEHPYPAQIVDTNLVFKWIEENSEKYGFDVDNVFAVGDSAGAHLLGIYAGILTSRDKENMLGITPPQNINLKAVALNCGKYFFTEDEIKNELDIEVSKVVFVDEFKKGDLTDANVTTYVHKDYPSAFVMTCPGDFLKEQAQFMIKALEDKNVPFLYRRYGDHENELCHVFHCDLKRKEAAIANKDECDFFRSFIKGVTYAFGNNTCL